MVGTGGEIDLIQHRWRAGPEEEKFKGPRSTFFDLDLDEARAGYRAHACEPGRCPDPQGIDALRKDLARRDEVLVLKQERIWRKKDPEIFIGSVELGRGLPRVLQSVDHDVADGCMWTVMRKLVMDGEGMRKYLRANPQEIEAVTIEMTRAVLELLTDAYTRNLNIRDLHRKQIFFAREGNAWKAWFGDLRIFEGEVDAGGDPLRTAYPDPEEMIAAPLGKAPEEGLPRRYNIPHNNLWTGMAAVRSVSDAHPYVAAGLLPSEKDMEEDPAKRPGEFAAGRAAGEYLKRKDSPDLVDPAAVAPWLRRPYLIAPTHPDADKRGDAPELLIRFDRDVERHRMYGSRRPSNWMVAGLAAIPLAALLALGHALGFTAGIEQAFFPNVASPAPSSALPTAAVATATPPTTATPGRSPSPTAPPTPGTPLPPTASPGTASPVTPTAPSPTLAPVTESDLQRIGRVVRFIPEGGQLAGAELLVARTFSRSEYPWMQRVDIDGDSPEVAPAGKFVTVWIWKAYRGQYSIGATPTSPPPVVSPPATPAPTAAVFIPSLPPVVASQTPPPFQCSQFGEDIALAPPPPPPSAGCVDGHLIVSWWITPYEQPCGGVIASARRYSDAIARIPQASGVDTSGRARETRGSYWYDTSVANVNRFKDRFLHEAHEPLREMPGPGICSFDDLRYTPTEHTAPTLTCGRFNEGPNLSLTPRPPAPTPGCKTSVLSIEYGGSIRKCGMVITTAATYARAMAILDAAGANVGSWWHENPLPDKYGRGGIDEHKAKYRAKYPETECPIEDVRLIAAVPTSPPVLPIGSTGPSLGEHLDLTGSEMTGRQWIAPRAGTYRFSTIGAYSTVAGSKLLRSRVMVFINHPAGAAIPCAPRTPYTVREPSSPLYVGAMDLGRSDDRAAAEAASRDADSLTLRLKAADTVTFVPVDECDTTAYADNEPGVSVIIKQVASADPFAYDVRDVPRTGTSYPFALAAGENAVATLCNNVAQLRVAARSSSAARTFAVPCGTDGKELVLVFIESGSEWLDGELSGLITGATWFGVTSMSLEKTLEDRRSYMTGCRYTCERLTAVACQEEGTTRCQKLGTTFGSFGATTHS